MNDKAEAYLEANYTQFNNWKYYPPSQNKVAELMQSFSDQEVNEAQEKEMLIWVKTVEQLQADNAELIILLRKAYKVLSQESEKSMKSGANREVVERNDWLRDAIKKDLFSHNP